MHEKYLLLYISLQIICRYNTVDVNYYQNNDIKIQLLIFKNEFLRLSLKKKFYIFKFFLSSPISLFCNLVS